MASTSAQIGVTPWDPERLRTVFELLERLTDTDELPAAALCIGTRDGLLQARFFGRQWPERNSPPLQADALFLVASLTKPVTVTAAMMLVERGLLTLDDRVAEFVPSFACAGKQEVRIRHLMTHTSGLPDMLPQNEALRAAHSPLSAFVDEIGRTPLLFPPGTQVQYQSMGTAMLGEVVRVVAGVPLPEFLRRELFVPLGMHDTSLGWQPDMRSRIAAVRIAPDQEATDWHWNTPYWLGFGAPWGGLITSPADFAAFCAMMLGDGMFGHRRVLGLATVRTMTSNQLAAMPRVPEEERRCRPWGLGWRLNWPGQSANFGDLLGKRTYGHWGATGTLCWIDPDAGAFAALFTTQPQGEDGRLLARVSNAVAAALV